MRVGFAGTPTFAAEALEAIFAAGFDVPVVLTQPDRPKGRGLAVQASATKSVALRHGVPLHAPSSLKEASARAPVLRIPLDVLVVAAYGLILPPALLEWPTHGALNIHASLLPRWRGAAPIQRALLAGDCETGISIMQMDAGLDTGPVVARLPLAIGETDTAGTLHDRLAALGAGAIVEALRRLERDGRLDSIPQPADGATYAAKVERSEAEIDWRASARSIDRQVRAFNPVPGAFTTHAGQAWKIWVARPLDETPDSPPGTVVRAGREGLWVACGTGELAVQELQPAGGKRLPPAAVLAGRRIGEGDVFGAADGRAPEHG